MDSPRSVQPISGSISSKQVSNVFLAQVTISTKSISRVHVLALLDSGANSCFMDKNFPQANKISLRKLPCPASVIVIDGRPIASENIVEESEPISVVLDNFKSTSCTGSTRSSKRNMTDNGKTEKGTVEPKGENGGLGGTGEDPSGNKGLDELGECPRYSKTD